MNDIIAGGPMLLDQLMKTIQAYTFCLEGLETFPADFCERAIKKKEKESDDLTH